MKQTAVEWMAEEFKDTILKEYGEKRFFELIEQAKEIEKQQMMQCYEDGYNRVAKLIEDATQRNLNL
jgi:hypothetical protein